MVTWIPVDYKLTIIVNTLEVNAGSSMARKNLFLIFIKVILMRMS